MEIRRPFELCNQRHLQWRSAALKVVSPALIAATLLPGARSDTVQVITLNGTLSNNVPFRVLPRRLMNGISGSGDFTRNAYLPIFTCPSTANGGKTRRLVACWLDTEIDI